MSALFPQLADGITVDWAAINSLTKRPNIFARCCRFSSVQRPSAVLPRVSARVDVVMRGDNNQCHMSWEHDEDHLMGLLAGPQQITPL